MGSETYTKKELAKLFDRPESFVDRLFKMGLPHCIACGGKEVVKKDFWNWMNHEEPTSDKSIIVNVRKLAKEHGWSKSAAYRMKDRMPKDVVFNVGRQCFIFTDKFYAWMSEQSKINPGGRL